MFGSLFDEESEMVATGYKCTTHAYIAPPRESHRFCGLKNQGSTCYLNALLQTLSLTPEFRNRLFKIEAEELHSVNGRKARLIPLHMQTLFTRLLMLDVDSVSTEELTDSFGWSCHEGSLQHDVQELNRILFAALESSLAGTSGSDLIHDLYKGILANKIQCLECSHSSYRKEDFMDLCLSVNGCDTLYKSLACFTADEYLIDNNKYFCSGCQKLSNAVKTCKIDYSPPILTISLLRFSYDFEKFERYKETGRLEFPCALDLAPYCEKYEDEIIYELFSVIIHSGGTHGGHYKAYICDLDNIGCWLGKSVEQSVKNVDINNPVDVVISLLKVDFETSMDQLCQDLEKVYKVSWKQKYKQKFGSINRFLKKYDDYFHFNALQNTARLKKEAMERSHNNDTNNNINMLNETKPWFEFNDTQVTPILWSDIEKQYSGTESAYMLFYRRRNNEERLSPEAYIPDYLLEKIIQENLLLAEQRKELDLTVYVGSKCKLEDGEVLQIDNGNSCFKIKWKSCSIVQDLLASIKNERASVLTKDDVVLHKLMEVPSGLHPISCLSTSPNSTLESFEINDKCKLLIWNGNKIDKCKIIPGREHVPILLVINLPHQQSFSCTFPLSAKIKEVKKIVVSKLFLEAEFFLMDENGAVLDDLESVGSLNLKDFDKLEVVYNDEKQIVSEIFSKKNENMKFIVENCCTEQVTENSWTQVEIEAAKDFTVEELKVITLSKLGITKLDVMQETRLAVNRIVVESSVLWLPLAEQMTVAELEVENCFHLALQSQPPLSLNQIVLFIKIPSDLTCTNSQEASKFLSNKWFDVVAFSDWTVEKLLKICKESFVQNSRDLHFGKLDWFGDVTSVLGEENLSLIDCKLNHGDVLCIQYGKATPKDHFKLFIYNNSPSQAVEFITISRNASLYQLKNEIMKSFYSTSIQSPHLLRLFHLTQPNNKHRLLKLDSQLLMSLGLSSESKIFVKCLREEEVLSKQDIILNLKVKIKGVPEYLNDKEIIWNISQGATVQNLYTKVATAVKLTEDLFHLAKHNPQNVKLPWILIPCKTLKDEFVPKKKNKCKNKKNSKLLNNEVINLRNNPFLMSDMDVIGVLITNSDDRSITAYDFMTSEEQLKKNNSICEVSKTVSINSFDNQKPLRLEPCVRITVDV